MAPNGSPPNGGKVKLNQIVPGVWLGNLYCATDESVLYTSGITAVLSVVDDGDVLYAPRFAANLPSFIHGERHRSIRASDSRSVNLLKHFDEIYDWIDHDSQTYVKSERNNVLVHCRMGLSRSATIVVAYVMKKFRTSFSAVLDYCKQQTSINPNSGFRRQLQAYEEMGYSIWEDDQRTRHKKEYKEYLAQDLRLKTRVDASGRIHPTTGSLSVRSSSTK
ncbi:phosphatases II [Pseudovirgaria hyperparasitica]|uniref:Phosphatases II n=1 Tax=Pseudovirgaria hyperparasitica TaxID=470096 RepID=A0A6A6WCH7_9PEZI|nr:phosphatases II [Pseudovirgaria hyperparasitica]KAF2759556.1 phosphatases II [Pseudovirgaria hyperparasitica]